MDINYLLFLQDLRNATGGMFDEFFNALSKFAVDVLPLLAFVLLWCSDKKWGYRFISTYSVGELLNGLIKLTVCAYRPWIRSDLIEPAGDSKVAATGYSFPSGHTLNATMHYGNVAVWQKKDRRWLAIVCAVLIVLTGFSRNFLGVHTPQDVFVAFLESVLLIFVVGKVQKALEGKDQLIDRLTIAGFFVVIAAILYITLKPYPMDYVNGALLVDPQVMMNDSFKAAGGLTGFLLGSYIERHYIHYEIPEASKRLPLLTWIGFAIIFSWKTYFAPATVVAAFGGHWGNFLTRFILFLFALVAWPVVIKKNA